MRGTRGSFGTLVWVVVEVEVEAVEAEEVVAEAGEGRGARAEKEGYREAGRPKSRRRLTPPSMRGRVVSKQLGRRKRLWRRTRVDVEPNVRPRLLRVVELVKVLPVRSEFRLAEDTGPSGIVVFGKDLQKGGKRRSVQKEAEKGEKTTY